MTIETINLAGSSSGIQLAVDLTFPSTLTIPVDGIVIVTGVNTTAGLTEMLGLSGRYAIEYVELRSLTTESAQIKLTVDGEVKWNDTFVLLGTSLILYGAQIQATTGGVSGTPQICNSSYSLEVQMSADASIDIAYSVRPIK